MNTNLLTVMLGIVFIAMAIMEFMRKHVNPKNENLKKALLTIIGLIVSWILTAIAFFAFESVSSHANALSIIIYGLIVYFAQKDIDMEILKPLLKKLIYKETGIKE